jgi:hypothetical protein
MIYSTEYMEVPLWKNLDSPRIQNPPIFYASPMPIKRKPPLTSPATKANGGIKPWQGFR